MNPLALLYGSIKSDMSAVEACIKASLNDEQYASIQSVNDYLLGAPGKRLRPALLLFCFRALSPDPTDEQVTRAVKVAAAIELIHMASLVHDDVIDHAPVRHNQPTIHTKWSQEIAVVYGVYLYSISLKLLTEAETLPVIGIVSETVKKLCQGEMSQVLSRGNLNLGLAPYLDVLREKTGVLFRAACECGAILSQSDDPNLQEALGKYGEDLGVVFQIADDTMDIMGDRDTLGKEPGQDLELGEVSLPLIYLLEAQDSESDRERFRQMMDQPSSEDMETLRQAIMETEISQKCVALGMQFLEDAASQLEELPSSPQRKSLHQLVDAIRSRAFKHVK